MTCDSPAWRPAAAALAMLAVCGIALAAHWNPWVALAVLGVAVGATAEALGTASGMVAAVVAAIGFILVIEERTSRVGTARGGPELGAFAVLLVIAMLLGRDRPKKG